MTIDYYPLSLPFFLALRLYRGHDAARQVSRPAVLIAMAGVAVGLAVMMISVAVIVGFKGTVRDKVSGFASHIQVTNREAAGSYEMRPIAAGDSLLRAIASQEGVSHVQRFTTKPAMIKTLDSFEGVVVKGVGPEYDLTFLSQCLVEGTMPQFCDTATTGQALISRTLADRLDLKLGDRIDTYFIQDEVRARRLTVSGIYQTNFSEYDHLFLLTDLHLLTRLNGWQADQVSGIEVRIDDYARLDDMTWALASDLPWRRDRYGAQYCVRNVEQLWPAIFAWLDILDTNVWVILVIMIGVAGFTMISGLLILIIERTATIGLLRSLGATSAMVRRVFLWLAVFLIGRGMLWGNAVGLAFYLVQRHTGLLRLDATNYYMDTVPVSLPPALFVLLNVGTLLLSVLMLLGPSYLIARIRPAETMRYE